MRKLKTKLYQKLLKLRIAYRIATGKYKHFVLLSLNEEQFTNAIAQSLFNDRYINEIGFAYIGMCEIHAYETILSSLATFDHDRLILMRAEFQADVDESMLYPNKNADGKRN